MQNGLTHAETFSNLLKTAGESPILQLSCRTWATNSEKPTKGSPTGDGGLSSTYAFFALRLIAVILRSEVAIRVLERALT